MIFPGRQGEKIPPHSWLLSKNFKECLKTQRLFLQGISPLTLDHLAAIIFYVYPCILGYEPLEDGTGFLNHLCVLSTYMLFE